MRTSAASRRLAQEIRETIKRRRTTRIAFRDGIFSWAREVRHGGWRSRQARFGSSGQTLRYNSSRVHEHVEVTGESAELRITLTA